MAPPKIKAMVPTLALLIGAAAATIGDRMASPEGVAVCFTGELRSFAISGHTLRTNLLEAWNADAFVVALSNSVADDRALLSDTLGPRLKSLSIGTASSILNTTLLTSSIEAPAQALGYVGRGARDHGDWPRKHSEQWLSRLRCQDLVAAEERRRGRPYAAYARLRLDTNLFAPLPASILALVASDADGRLAVIPTGNDFGTCGNCSVTDKMLIGGRAAFDADSTMHASMIDGVLPALTEVWVPEGLTKAHLVSRGVVIKRHDIAFCVMSISGTCRYPEELLRSESILSASGHPNLLSDHPALCPKELSYEPCEPTRSQFPQTE